MSTRTTRRPRILVSLRHRYLINEEVVELDIVLLIGPTLPDSGSAGWSLRPIGPLTLAYRLTY